MHETAATPSVSLAAVAIVSLAAVAMCVCVFPKTMYLDRQRYTVFWPYTICRPHTKTKISRTSGQTDRRSVFFFLHVAIRNSLRSNNTGCSLSCFTSDSGDRQSVMCSDFSAFVFESWQTKSSRIVRDAHTKNARLVYFNTSYILNHLSGSSDRLL